MISATTQAKDHRGRAGKSADAQQLYSGVAEKLGVGEKITTTQLAAHAEAVPEQKLPVSEKNAIKSSALVEDDWR